jgi:hypothetical protein
MNANDIADAIAAVRAKAGVSLDPARRGPVPLDRLFQAANLTHAEVPALSTAAVLDHLVAERFVSGPQVVAEVPRSDDRIEGFLFWSGGDGLAFVNADDILPRRRFTAAHELGHALLHRERMGRFRADVKIDEAAEATDPMEREANRFAAELLRPAEVCRAREVELRHEHGCCPRGVIGYSLAAELLVSQQTMRFRLQALGVGDE